MKNKCIKTISTNCLMKDNKIKTNYNMEFNEYLDIEGCAWFLTLSYEEKTNLFTPDDLEEKIKIPNGLCKGSGRGTVFRTQRDKEVNYKEYMDDLTKFCVFHFEKGKPYVRIQYAPAEGRKGGRVYTKRRFSGQNIPSVLRPYLLADGHSELDMSNAFPTILYHILNKTCVMNLSITHHSGEVELKETPFALKTFKKFIDNPDHYRTKWAEEMKVDKTRVKRLINKYLNKDLTNFKSWSEDVSLDISKGDECVCNSKSFMKIINGVAKAKYHCYHFGIYEGEKDNTKHNPISSGYSLLLERQEKRMRKIAIDLLQTLGGSNLSIIPLHDGIITNVDIDEALIEKVEELTQSVNPYIKWARKDIAHIRKEVDYSKIDGYDFQKARWEANAFLIKNISGTTSRAGAIGYYFNNLAYSLKDFQQLMKEYTYLNGAGKRVNIQAEWEADPNKRSYDNLKFIPFPVGQTDPCELSNDYNTFKGFPRSLNDNDNKYDWDSRLLTPLEIVKDIISYLTTEEKMEEIILSWLVDLVQYPHRPNQKILVIKGLAGTGKSTLFNIIEKMLGSEHFLSEATYPNVLGAETPDVENKIVFKFEEGEREMSKKWMAQIKSATTARTIPIKRKYIPTVNIDHIARWVIISNEHNPIEPDRRTLISQVKSHIFINPHDISVLYNTYLKDREWLDILYTQLLTYKGAINMVAFEYISEIQTERIVEKKTIIHYFYDVLVYHLDWLMKHKILLFELRPPDKKFTPLSEEEKLYHKQCIEEMKSTKRVYITRYNLKTKLLPELATVLNNSKEFDYSHPTWEDGRDIKDLTTTNKSCITMIKRNEMDWLAHSNPACIEIKLDHLKAVVDRANPNINANTEEMDWESLRSGDLVL